MRKKALLLIGFIVVSMFLFIQPTKAMLDYDHTREFDYLRPNQSAVIWFGFLYSVKPFHWEFTTILDDMQINVTLATQHSDPYWIERWDLSSNKTNNYGVFTVSEPAQYQLYCKNIGNTSGYIMMDLWIDRPPSGNSDPLWNFYILPENRTETLWEWQSHGNIIEQYHAVECHFQATEYDAFLVAYSPSISPVMFMDKNNFDKWIEDGIIYNNNIKQVFCNWIDMVRPTHNDTWYFVFVNGYDEEEVNLSVAIRYTQNYYGEPEPDPDPDPDPDPEPKPTNLNNQIINIILTIVTISAIAIVIPVLIIQKRKKRVSDEVIRPIE